MTNLGTFIYVTLLFIFMVAVIIFLMKKCDRDEGCDERQIQVRGEGYRIGFVSLLLMITFVAVLKGLDVVLPFAEGVLEILVVLVSVGIWGIYVILKDAYLGKNRTKKSTTVSLACIGTGNFIMGLLRALDGEIWEDGKISFSCINLACGAMILLLLLVFVIRMKAQEKEDEE